MAPLRAASRALLPALLATLLAGLAQGDEGPRDPSVCGGRGTIADEDTRVCVCDDSFPEPGQSGWTGSECQIPVYGARLDGTDVTDGCHAQGCGQVEAHHMVCFALPIIWRDFNDPWNFMTMQLNRTSPHGDPDLYGAFTGGASREGCISALLPMVVATLWDFR
eukprot:evm.model.scf_3717.1 EVM.evm.TU.scf_3717.1   scf_3717:5085-9130(-)